MVGARDGWMSSRLEPAQEPGLQQNGVTDRLRAGGLASSSWILRGAGRVLV